MSVAEAWQNIGRFYELGSRQATTKDEFTRLRALSVTALQKAGELFGNEQNNGKSQQCYAEAEYANSWLSPDHRHRSEKLDKCRTFAKSALRHLKNAGKDVEYCKTANLLSKCLFERLYITSQYKEKISIAHEGIQYATDAIQVLSKIENKQELVLAFSQGSILYWYLANICEVENRKDAANNAINYANNAINLSNQTDDPYCKALALWGAGWSNLYFSDDVELAMKYAKEMLEQATKVEDNFLKGIASFIIADTNDMKISVETNPDNVKELYHQSLKHSQDGIRFLDLVSQYALMSDLHGVHGEAYLALSSDFVDTISERIAYLEKAVDIAKTGLEHAVRAGSPEGQSVNLHVLSKALSYRSKLESKKEERIHFLNEALSFRKEFINIAKGSFPFNQWVFGVGVVHLAKIKTSLYRLIKDKDEKIRLLKEAIADSEQGIFLCKNWIAFNPVPIFLSVIAGYEDTLGELLDESYRQTQENESLIHASEIYSDAAKNYEKAEIPSRAAECYWKIARNFDLVGEYSKASENFEKSYTQYKVASDKLCNFQDFYLDYASYMMAWKEIESAKQAHNTEEYVLAMQHYEKTSILLKESKSWNHLSLNFFSWSLIEQAEGLSRKEKCKESIVIFQRAIRLLRESEGLLRSKLPVISRRDEQILVRKLIQASGNRVEYSFGRIAIEEAKSLTKQGEREASAQKYDFAAGIFKKIIECDYEHTEIEAIPLMYLCQAWQKMNLAETKSSPILYKEAAELFTLANEHSTKESTSLLALGHSSFCKALETGVEYEAKKTITLYQESTKYLGSAANYYLRAHFEALAGYVKAVQNLFTAYFYMDNAKREKDLALEVKYYLMTEKLLKVASRYFAKSGYAGKGKQVKRLLKEVREERNLALSLSEVFHAPSITTSTATFAAIEPKDENAAGLERFEHAAIQAKVTQNKTDYKIGEEVRIEIQIVNVGKEPVLITKIENIIPPGLQITLKPDYYFVDGKALTTLGRKIDPLKTNKIELAFKSLAGGLTETNPKIIWVDQLGNQMTQLLESMHFNILGAPADFNKKIESESSKLKPFDVFLCYKKSTGKDFADHLKVGLEELGLHSFLDTKDIPLAVEGQEGWAKARDKALDESKFFVLIMTPGFNLSSEVLKEIAMSRKDANKIFVFFRHRNMGRKIIVNLDHESLDIGKLEQVSFETKEELLRLASSILLK